VVGDWDAFLQQVAQWTEEMERFMAHVDAARAATLSSMTLAPPAAVLWRPAATGWIGGKYLPQRGSSYVSCLRSI
jgi:hypothetical protein